jgi:hypothetical protein
MDADKEGNSDIFCIWQILSPRFFLASQKIKVEPSQVVPVAVRQQAPTSSPGDLLLDSPAARNLIPINSESPEFSLLDSPVNAARRQPAKDPAAQAADDSLI